MECRGGGQPPCLCALASGCSAGYCSLSTVVQTHMNTHSRSVCVCVHCAFRLISVTLSPGDEAGQITLSAQPTHPAQYEECEQQLEELYDCIFQSKLLCAEVVFCVLIYL